MTLTDARPSSPAVAQPVPLPSIEIAPQAKRLASLDIFRGIAIAAMMLVNNPGDWGHVYAPLLHAKWHGWTITDLIFPFFLFIVGVAIPFSLARRSSAAAATRGSLLAGIWSRTLALVMLGLLLHAIPSSTVDPLPASATTLKVLRVVTYPFLALSFFALLYPWKSRSLAVLLPLFVALTFFALLGAIHFANKDLLAAGLPANFRFGNGMWTPYTLRLPGVLQRIGVCYGVAATIALFAGTRAVIVWAIVLMAGYSIAMLAVPYHDHVTGSLTAQDNLARRIDEDVFREHNYNSYPDPEGLLSTLPAIATVLLGIWVGAGLRSERLSAAEKCARVLAMGVIVTCTGVLLDWWLMPINKQIWTPSFTVFTAGLGMLALGATYYIADLRGRRGWAILFTIYGMNAIAAFVFSGILNRAGSMIRWRDAQTDRQVNLLGYVRDAIADAMAGFASPEMASLAYALLYVLLILLLMAVLYRFKVFIKV